MEGCIDREAAHFTTWYQILKFKAAFIVGARQPFYDQSLRDVMEHTNQICSCQVLFLKLISKVKGLIYLSIGGSIQMSVKAGKSVLSVYQDFHAKVFTKNLVWIMAFPGNSAYSARSRPLIPLYSGHPFRPIPAIW